MASRRGIAVLASSLDENAGSRTPTRRGLRRTARRRIDHDARQPRPQLPRRGAANGHVDRLRRPSAGVLRRRRRDGRQPSGHDARRQASADHGHRRIAFLGDRRSIVTAAERFRGFVDALDASGIVVDSQLVRQDSSTASMPASATLDLLSLDEPPTAIFAAQNLVTIGVVRALRSAGQTPRHGPRRVRRRADGRSARPGDHRARPRSDRHRQAGGHHTCSPGSTATARRPRPTSFPTTMIIRGSGEIRPPH